MSFFIQKIFIHQIYNLLIRPDIGSLFEVVSINKLIRTHNWKGFLVDIFYWF